MSKKPTNNKNNISEWKKFILDPNIKILRRNNNFMHQKKDDTSKKIFTAIKNEPTILSQPIKKLIDAHQAIQDSIDEEFVYQNLHNKDDRVEYTKKNTKQNNRVKIPICKTQLREIKNNKSKIKQINDIEYAKYIKECLFYENILSQNDERYDGDEITQALTQINNVLVDLPYVKNCQDKKITNEIYIESNYCLPPKQIKNIKAGKGNIDAVIDLHGYNMISAFHTLKEFIYNAFFKNFRLLLVITGKGKASENVTLNRMIHTWVNEPSLKEKILYFCFAAPYHGGKGAFYIFLRKNKKRSW